MTCCTALTQQLATLQNLDYDTGRCFNLQELVLQIQSLEIELAQAKHELHDRDRQTNVANLHLI